MGFGGAGEIGGRGESTSEKAIRGFYVTTSWMLPSEAPRGEDLALALRTGDQLLREAISDRLTPLRLNWTEFLAIDRIGQGTHLVSHLGRDLGISVSVTIGLVDDLESRGLVMRSPDLHDRRTKRIDLTPNGRSLLRNSRSAAQTVISELLEALPPNDAEALYRLLEEFNQSLRLRQARRPERPAPTPRANTPGSPPGENRSRLPRDPASPTARCRPFGSKRNPATPGDTPPSPRGRGTDSGSQLDLEPLPTGQHGDDP